MSNLLRLKKHLSKILLEQLKFVTRLMRSRQEVMLRLSKS